MKATTQILAAATAVLLALGGAGCKKQQAAAAQSPKTLEEGVTQLRIAFNNAGPKLQNDLYNGVDSGVHYGNYKEAAAALARIASDPSLNEQQKKLVNAVSELLKAKLQATPGTAKPAP